MSEVLDNIMCAGTINSTSWISEPSLYLFILLGFIPIFITYYLFTIYSTIMAYHSLIYLQSFHLLVSLIPFTFYCSSRNWRWICTHVYIHVHANTILPPLLVVLVSTIHLFMWILFLKILPIPTTLATSLSDLKYILSPYICALYLYNWDSVIQ